MENTSASDFQQIAEQIAENTGVGRLEEWDRDDPGRVIAEIAGQLSETWTARGQADKDAVADTLRTLMGASAADPYVKAIEKAIDALERKP